MGIFGVIAGAVTRRRHELAVRLAVGAEHRSVLALVAREAALLVAVGVMIGVPGVFAASGLIRGALVGVSPSDPRTLGGVVVGLAFVTLATGYAAARRVLKIDPAELLRRD
jgi:putative ABC transport system permease protein